MPSSKDVAAFFGAKLALDGNGYGDADDTPTNRGRLRNAAQPPLWSTVADWMTVFALFCMLVWLERMPPFRKIIIEDGEMWQYKYPVKPNTVPTWAVPTISLVVAPCALAIVLLIVGWQQRGAAAFDRRELHRAVLGIYFSVTFAAFATNVIKVLVGRPRPNFYSRCFPTGVTARFDELSLLPLCTPAHPYDEIEGRKSFPSGHTAWTTAALAYLAFVLFAKLRVFSGSGSPWRLLVGVAPLFMSVLVGVSRVRDYWHHPTDVMAGFVLGLLCAWMSFRQHYRSLCHASSHQPLCSALPLPPRYAAVPVDAGLGLV